MKPKKSKDIEMKAAVLIGATVLVVLLSVATLLLYIQDLRQGQAKHEASSPPVTKTSAQTLTFYASTQQAGTSYTIGIYRLGWYQGMGGRLMTSSPALIGQAQGYYAPNSGRLIGCASCYVDSQTGLIEARWRPSYRLTVPTGWTSGIYLAKFIDAHNMQTYATFDVI